MKRLKTQWGEAGGSAPVRFLARVPRKVQPAGSPGHVHEFPEGPLEVSGYFPKAKKKNSPPGKPKAWKKRHKIEYDTKRMQSHCMFFIYKGGVQEVQHSFAASLHVGGRLKYFLNSNPC